MQRATHPLLRVALGVLVLAVTSLAHGAQDPALTVVAHHTRTGDVRGIAIAAGRVWAATRGGLAVHDESDGRFLFKLTAQHGLPGNSLQMVRVIDDDHLLVGGDYGAAVLDRLAAPRAGVRLRRVRRLGDPGRFEPVFDAVVRGQDSFRHPSGSDPVDGNVVHLLVFQRGLVALTESEGGELFASPIGRGRLGMWRSAALADDGGVVLGGLDGTVARFGREPRRRASAFDDGSRSRTQLEFPVFAIASHDGGHLIATGEALYLKSGERVRELFDIRGGQRRIAASTLAGAGAATLVGTQDGAIFVITGDEAQRLAGTGADRVTALALAGQHLWVGLGRSGLHRLTLRGLELSASLRPAGEICDNHVTKLTRHRGALVAGTFDRGACVLRADGWHELPGLPSPFVHGVASDGHHLWVASSGGISRFDEDFDPAPIGSGDPGALQWLATTAATGAAEVGPGQVVLSSKHGIVRIWHKRNGRHRIRFTSHERGVPFAISGLAAAGGEVFVASEKEGLKRMGYAEGTAHYQDPTHLPENWVTAAHATGPDSVWVATCQGGAVFIRQGVATRIDTAAGLVDDRVTAVAGFDGGGLVGTLEGVAWVSADGAHIENFGVGAGIPDPRSAGLRVEGVNAWLGTESGLAEMRLGRAVALAAAK